MPYTNYTKEAVQAVQRAQKWVELAQSNPAGYSESQNHLVFAQEQVANAQQAIANASEEEKKELRQAADLLRLLKQTQQSISNS
ncbi:hypothetical protein [Sediminibacillus albus]|uniref:DUF3813 domain-containing protein n=1 Tax=Sediminibacillus albus TaxID=407036 RepID=A0A1G9ANT4_9BACI|nr:hypothetical protein [Sediminibacillus albus]SDK28903.1 hypothetical protein SAMN05216243_2632 [Sediminibacillus albus]